MQTITFYSYKGGLGRTLVVANVARYLSLFRKNVFVVDFDLEAPGLHYKLSLEGGERRIGRGLVDYIHKFLLGEGPEGLGRYAVEVERKNQSEGSIRLLPAGSITSSEYWQKLAQIDWHDLFYSEGAKGIPFFLELKAQIEEEFSPDYLLIDARTGITEVGGVATTLLADTVVCLLLNNRENLEGAREVLRGIRRALRLPGQAQVQIVPVVARLPELDDRRQEERILEEVRVFLNEEAPDLVSTLNVEEVLVLHVDPELQLREFLRVGGVQSPEESVLLRDYLRLFARLIPQEVIRTYLEPLIGQVVEKEARDPEGARKDLDALIRASYNRELCLELFQLMRSRRQILTDSFSRAKLPDESLLAGLPTASAKDKPLTQRQMQYYLHRGAPIRGHLHVTDARDLRSTGWAVLFPKSCDPALREALQPLLEHRRAQVTAQGARHLYREYKILPGEGADEFLDRHGVGPGPIDPHSSPYYLLIVGDPESVSFDLQQQLGVQYGVGRLCFDTLEEYERYARNVVEIETGEARRAKLVSLFGPQNPDDNVTRVLTDLLVSPLATDLKESRPDWGVELLTSEDATKSRLRTLLESDLGPALLLAVSHGAVFSSGDPRQMRDQGALVCQEWPGPTWKGPLPANFYFSASDVPETADVRGLVAFLYSSFTAGTQPYETRWWDPDFVEHVSRTPRPFIARLPQRLLSHPAGGALAVIGKTNSGWLSFLERGGTEVCKSVIKLLTQGYPVGAAMGLFGQFSAELSLRLVESEGGAVYDGLEGSDLRDRFLRRAIDDARSFIVLGDPAVRLATPPTPA